MPHKCTECKEEYYEQAPELLQGCKCGNRVFQFIKNDYTQTIQPPFQITNQMASLQPTNPNVNQEQKNQEVESELDPAENIKVLEPGAYELNLDRLMNGEPVTLKTEKEVYFVSFKIQSRKSTKLPKAQLQKDPKARLL